MTVWHGECHGAGCCGHVALPGTTSIIPLCTRTFLNSPLSEKIKTSFFGNLASTYPNLSFVIFYFLAFFSALVFPLSLNTFCPFQFSSYQSSFLLYCDPQIIHILQGICVKSTKSKKAWSLLWVHSDILITSLPKASLMLSSPISHDFPAFCICVLYPQWKCATVKADSTLCPPRHVPYYRDVCTEGTE